MLLASIGTPRQKDTTACMMNQNFILSWATEWTHLSKWENNGILNSEIPSAEAPSWWLSRIQKLPSTQSPNMQSQRPMHCHQEEVLAYSHKNHCFHGDTHLLVGPTVQDTPCPNFLKEF
jgi:hypothetical protein